MKAIIELLIRVFCPKYHLVKKRNRKEKKG